MHNNYNLKPIDVWGTWNGRSMNPFSNNIQTQTLKPISISTPTYSNIATLPSINKLPEFKSDFPTLELPKTNVPQENYGGTKNFKVNQQLLSGITNLSSAFDSTSTESQKTMKQGIHQGLQSFGPIGSIISAAAGVVDAIGSETGLNLDNIDKDTAERTGLNTSYTISNIANSLPGVSASWGLLTGGKKTNDFTMSSTLGNLKNAYSLTALEDAENLSNKNILFGRNKANSVIDNAKNTQNKLIELDNINSKRQNATAIDVNKKYTSPSLFSSRAMLAQKGGKLHVIAAGALHARKHDLIDNEEFKGNITTKGIPVISKSENGGVLQHAEIEVGELIFNLEVTKELERLYKLNTEESAIEAGKLMAKAIVKDTKDNTKQII